MAKEDLKPLNTLTKEEQKKICSAGGKASVESRRKRKTLKEELLLLLSENDVQKNVSLALIAKALTGDVKAFEAIRDSVGERFTEKTEISGGNIEININRNAK